MVGVCTRTCGTTFGVTPSYFRKEDIFLDLKQKNLLQTWHFSRAPSRKSTTLLSEPLYPLPILEPISPDARRTCFSTRKRKAATLTRLWRDHAVGTAKQKIALTEFLKAFENIVWGNARLSLG